MNKRHLCALALMCGLLHTQAFADEIMPPQTDEPSQPVDTHQIGNPLSANMLESESYQAPQPEEEPILVQVYSFMQRNGTDLVESVKEIRVSGDSVNKPAAPQIPTPTVQPLLTPEPVIAAPAPQAPESNPAPDEKPLGDRVSDSLDHAAHYIENLF